MTRVDFLTIAEGANLQPDGKFNIIGGGITRFNAQALPAQIPTMVVVGRILRDEMRPGETLEFSIEGPSGGIGDSLTFEIPHETPAGYRAQPGEQIASVALFSLVNFPLTDAGSYRVVLRHPETSEVIGEAPFIVVADDEEQA
jgi:hypothetical protein